MVVAHERFFEDDLVWWGRDGLIAVVRCSYMSGAKEPFIVVSTHEVPLDRRESVGGGQIVVFRDACGDRYRAPGQFLTHQHPRC